MRSKGMTSETEGRKRMVTSVWHPATMVSEDRIAAVTSTSFSLHIENTVIGDVVVQGQGKG